MESEPHREAYNIKGEEVILHSFIRNPLGEGMGVELDTYRACFRAMAISALQAGEQGQLGVFVPNVSRVVSWR